MTVSGPGHVGYFLWTVNRNFDWLLLAASKATMPSLPRVMSQQIEFMRFINSCPAEKSRWLSLPMLILSAASTSGSFGVAAVNPLYSSRR